MSENQVRRANISRALEESQQAELRDQGRRSLSVSISIYRLLLRLIENGAQEGLSPCLVPTEGNVGLLDESDATDHHEKPLVQKSCV